MTTQAGLFPALLKHWRSQRGLSQLDLALAADVSSRHISFLETGRSAPSQEMVLRLANTLDVPLRHTNAMLEAAGFPAYYQDTEMQQGLDALPDEIRHALDLMKRHHEPYPFIVLDSHYNVLDVNLGTLKLFELTMPALSDTLLSGHRSLDELPTLNLVSFTFMPGGPYTHIENFDDVGQALLWRLQREVLANPEDHTLRELLEDTIKLPTVSPDWRKVDLTRPSLPSLLIHIKVQHEVLRFVTLITSFQTPQSTLLDELRIETWLPADTNTATIYQRLTSNPS